MLEPNHCQIMFDFATYSQNSMLIMTPQYSSQSIPISVIIIDQNVFSQLTRPVVNANVFVYRPDSFLNKKFCKITSFQFLVANSNSSIYANRQS